MMTDLSTRSEPATVACQLTGPGRGAVATVGLHGPSAAAAVDRFFTAASGRTAGEFRLQRIYFGVWASEQTNEELVVCRTAEVQFEIHCHGGRAAVQQILHSLSLAGIHNVDWAAWVARQDATEHENAAKLLLPHARTTRTVAILLDQVRGAAQRLIDDALAALDDGRPRHACQLLEAALARAPLGRRLTKPWTVVLTGPPNVGKSSLVNALVGFQRAIVQDQPGTTRDLVTTETVIDGWPVELTDTAGLRDDAGAIEAEGIRQARAKVAAADLVVEVIDLSNADWAECSNQSMLDGATGSVGERSGRPDERDPPRLRVGTKADLAEIENAAGLDVVTSAETGAGVPRLLDLISQRLVPNSPAANDAVPLTEEHCAELQELLRRFELEASSPRLRRDQNS